LAEEGVKRGGAGGRKITRRIRQRKTGIGESEKNKRSLVASRGTPLWAAHFSGNRGKARRQPGREENRRGPPKEARGKEKRSNDGHVTKKSSRKAVTLILKQLERQLERRKDWRAEAFQKKKETKNSDARVSGICSLFEKPGRRIGRRGQAGTEFKKARRNSQNALVQDKTTKKKK